MFSKTTDSNSLWASEHHFVAGKQSEIDGLQRQQILQEGIKK